MNLKFDTDTPKGVSSIQDSSVYLVVGLAVAEVDGGAEHGGIGGPVMLHDGLVVVHALCRGHDPIGIGSCQEVQAAKVLAVVEAVEVEHSGSEGWECVLHDVEV